MISRNYKYLALIMAFMAMLLLYPACLFAGDVGLKRARQVALNWLAESDKDKGLVKGGTYRIIDQQPIVVNGRTVGFNFILSPRGHIIVPSKDELPVVKLYSFESTLSMADENDATRWIKEELFKLNDVIGRHAAELSAVDHAKTRNGRLWKRFEKDSATFSVESATADQESATATSIGPLLTTTWSQGDPYNLSTPKWYDGISTITGCVATAAAQIMRYWNYPDTGQSSTSYSWYNGSYNQTLSANFASSTYDWASMINSYSSGSTTVQKQAVAKLMADVGIAFQMNYGKSGSSASTMYGVTVFPTYFKYKNTIHAVYRTNYASDSAWMQVFKSEVQNGRPSQLRISDPSAGGHSVVVDGYRDSPLEQIHINMGWAGSYNAWYVTNNIVTGSYNWSDVNYQGAVIGIEPSTASVTVSVTGNGSVNSDPTGIACDSGNSGVCTYDFPLGQTVTLMPTASSDSMFDSWSGNCDGFSGSNCLVNMTSAKSASATFVTFPPVTTGGSYFDSLQSAYGAGDIICTIEAKAVDLNPLDFTLGDLKTVLLKGGFDSSFSSNSGGYTVMDGVLTVQTGSLTVENLVIK